MLKNYFKCAWRNIIKNRTFSIINIAGLSFFVAFCLLLFFYIKYKQSYDAFHTKTILYSTANIVISAWLSKKYFGNINAAVGKTIELITGTTQNYIIN